MSGFQWLILCWLAALTVGQLRLRWRYIEVRNDLISNRIRVRTETAQTVTDALVAHSAAPLRHAHPGGRR